MREGQAITATSERTAISWTGGKDCNLALLDAWRNPALNVVNLVVFQPEGGGFHAHPIPLMKAQADALALPLRLLALPSNVSYKDGYVGAIRKLRDDDGIKVICTGDMDLVGNMDSNWMQDRAKEAGGVRAYLPLWEAKRYECLDKLVAEKFSIIYSCVKSPWFDKSWVGRLLDVDAIREMKKMSTPGDGSVSHDGNKSPENQPLDMGGENGEYHTMCLDGPVYQHSIKIEFGEPKEFAPKPAKEGEQRWWSFEGQEWWTIGDIKIIST